MSLLIISGLSGAGKSLVSNCLEDLGYFCIDNLPPQLLSAVSKLQADSTSANKMAVVMDSRSQEMFEQLDDELDRLDADGIPYKLVFLFAEPDVLLNRYKQTRRKHPLLSEQTPSLEDAIRKEIEQTKAIHDRADYEIDTSYLKNSQLRQTIIDMFGEHEYDGIVIKLISFGYRNGIPNEADLVFDVRCMPNPFYIDELRTKNGLDKEVYDYVFSFEQSRNMGEDIARFVTSYMPYYTSEGKNELIIAIGCTSGHHRSVSFVKYVKNKLEDSKYQIIEIHRDIDKEF